MNHPQLLPAPASKLKSVKIKDDPPLAIVMKELNNKKLQVSRNQSSYSRSNKSQQEAIWYLESGCSRYMTGVKSYLYKYVEQPGPKMVFRDDSTCITEGYGSINCNGKVFTKFDEKRGTIFNSNKEVVMIAPRGRHYKASFKTKQTSSIKKCLHLLHMDLFGPVTPRSIKHEKYTLIIVDEYSRNSILVNFYDEKGISQNFSFPYTPEQNGVAKRKNKTLIEAARTMLLRSVFSK
ncbi:retrovirus-related pol polyprotein from transposon TNT 1-94 [Tanacetum coccineum]